MPGPTPAEDARPGPEFESPDFTGEDEAIVEAIWDRIGRGPADPVDPPEPPARAPDSPSPGS